MRIASLLLLLLAFPCLAQRKEPPRNPPLSPEDGARVHGKDERIFLAALDWYADFLRELVKIVAEPAARSQEGDKP